MPSGPLRRGSPPSQGGIEILAVVGTPVVDVLALRPGASGSVPRQNG